MVSMTRDTTIAIVTPALLVTLAMLVAPHVGGSPGVADAVTFGGAACLAVLGVTLGTVRALPGRVVLLVDLVAATILAALAVLRVKSPWLTPLVDTCLLALAWATGGAIGARIEDPGHLLPAAAVAAAADIVSVASSWGPSHAIASSERALALLAISFPVIGTRAVAPALGVGDLVFVALMLAAARAHRLPVLRIAVLALLGVLVAGFGSAMLGKAVPALPAIGAMVIAFVPQTRTLRRKDRTVATVAIGVSIVVAVFGVINALRSGG